MKLPHVVNKPLGYGEITDYLTVSCWKTILPTFSWGQAKHFQKGGTTV